MNRDAEFHDEDEGTWQQPLPPQGSSRPHDQPTLRQAPADLDQDEPESIDAPEVTNPLVTAPEAEVSQVPPDTADTKESSDPQATQAYSSSGSSEWDQVPPPVFEKGQVVFGKYRLVEKIGEGGMGEVWRIWHVGLESERALKLIKAEIAQNDKGWRRFKREAQLMAKINHPNAVAVYDFDRKQSVGYIEMEFVRGRSLAEILKERGDQPMPLTWTAQVLDQLCAVLQEAHGYVDERDGKAKPIIHRDLKPSNLMLVDRKDPAQPPRLKVLDFGIAKIVEDEGSPELTAAGDLVGTPAYMSPEQIQGGFDRGEKHELDGRSDLYSTGVVLYHLLTGVLPFRGNKMALLAAHLNNAPLPMKEANPKAEVLPEVEKVVLQCLEKDPARRPQTARELAEKFLQAAGVSEVAAPAPTTGMPPWLKLAAAAVLVVVLAAGAMAFFRKPARIPPSLPPPVVDQTNGDQKAKPPSPPPREVGWPPKGYAAVDPDQTVPDRPDLPRQLRRQDGITFTHLRGGLYLPVGYSPESEETAPGIEQWPRAILRDQDHVRFIRISGATYLRGDPREGQPVNDSAGNPIKPHFVQVPGFYIQETEVTYDEIKQYLKGRLEDEDQFQRCREFYQANSIDLEKQGKSPVVCVTYRMARRYANSVGGLLPTEAEWEWAAKSCLENNLFAWRGGFTQVGQSSRAHLYDPNAATPAIVPVPVKSFPEDKTDQGVYDLVGNVSELCADAYKSYSSLGLAKNSARTPLVDDRPVDDPTGGGNKVKVVVRGGNYAVGEQKAMAFLRDRVDPDDIPTDIGFRVVIECPSRTESAH